MDLLMLVLLGVAFVAVGQYVFACADLVDSSNPGSGERP